jgi:translation initiation factor 3 subunit J
MSRLQEESDLEAARAAFGAGVDAVDVDALSPASQKEFEDYGRIVSAKYITRHAKSKHYKDLMKTLLKSSLQSLDVQQIKDLEACLAGVRSDKLKEEAAAKAKSKSKFCVNLHIAFVVPFMKSMKAYVR